MEEDDQDSVGDGDYGPLFAFARESAELRREVGVLAVRGSPCCLTETPTHPDAAVACFSTEARFPALSWLPGHSPAQLARCCAEGNCCISTPISAMMLAAATASIPGTVVHSSTAFWYWHR